VGREPFGGKKKLQEYERRRPTSEGLRVLKAKSWKISGEENPIGEEARRTEDKYGKVDTKVNRV